MFGRIRNGVEGHAQVLELGPANVLPVIVSPKDPKKLRIVWDQL